MERYTLGIDTSCYTTSIAIVDEDERIIFDKRIVLEVKEGKKGLRQSEALFQHVNNLPILFKEMSTEIDTFKIKKICYSNAPRFVKGSYMPVFKAGKSFGDSIGALLNISVKECSHQEGHIEAARWSANANLNNRFITVHISGGTTEILRTERVNGRYKTEIIGGTLDISAGQLIDRIGVAMGLEFPCGKGLDDLSTTGKLGTITVPVSVKDTYINFSGAETYIKKIIGSKKREDISIGLFECIYKSLFKSIGNAAKNTKINDVLLVGGVASNQFIRDNLYRSLQNENINVYFGKKEYCTDNAVGTALLGIQ